MKLRCSVSHIRQISLHSDGIKTCPSTVQTAIYVCIFAADRARHEKKKCQGFTLRGSKAGFAQS